VDDFWGTHWWLIIVLLAMCFPIAGMIMGAWAQHHYFQQRREAMETLKIYAKQGKEPPPEVVDALGGGWGRRWRGGQWRDVAAGFATAASAAAASGATQTDWYAARAARFEARAARWRAREPLRRWHNAILMSALTGGLYLASQHIRDAVISDRFLIAAIIVGALAAAAVLSAVLATAIRPK
jgi:hypothetical protein